MNIETVEATFLEHSEFVTLVELAERSGLSENELRELSDCGVFGSIDTTAVTFESRSILVARTARRVREELALDDTHALAIVLRLFQRIEALQEALRMERARR
ncbi:MAG TPA: chaperone modulator CbpM [Casimicrobiaceae bacterium]